MSDVSISSAVVVSIDSGAKSGKRARYFEDNFRRFFHFGNARVRAQWRVGETVNKLPPLSSPGPSSDEQQSRARGLG